MALNADLQFPKEYHHTSISRQWPMFLSCVVLFMVAYCSNMLLIVLCFLCFTLFHIVCNAWFKHYTKVQLYYNYHHLQLLHVLSKDLYAAKVRHTWHWHIFWLYQFIKICEINSYDCYCIYRTCSTIKLKYRYIYHFIDTKIVHLP